MKFGDPFHPVPVKLHSSWGKKKQIEHSWNTWLLLNISMVEVRVRKLKNGKAACKDEVTGEMIKGGGDRVVDLIWRLYNMVFESGGVPKEWRSGMVVQPYNGEGKGRNIRIIEILV